jgi:glycosyltransferase involved in cell wall biosynthesis
VRFVSPSPPDERIRVLRVIARMNVGGPAHHVSLLSGRLDPDRYETLLVHGRVGEAEGSFAHLAEREGCRVQTIESLRPELDPRSDTRALAELARVVRSFRPHLVHTHTAKAGFLGRSAARLAGRRPLVVHTYHGHVLEGYFGPAKNLLYRSLERGLARASDALIGVSGATVDDLVRLRVAPRDQFRVLPIGLDLRRFTEPDAEAVEAFRAANDARPDVPLVGYVGRLVPIKRVDILLRAFAELRVASPATRLSIVGDGECRAELERLAGALGIADAVRFHGYAGDVAAATSAADVAVLSSDNEGTPVSLIEAGAAGRPAAATAVGGVPDVVTAGTGLLVPPGDPSALADALLRLVREPGLRRAMGAHAQGHVLERYSVERLVKDVDSLYSELLAHPAQASEAQVRGRRGRSLREIQTKAL